MRSLCFSLLFLMLGLSACSPGLDWREVRPEGADVLALFPCKPTFSAHPATRAEPVSMGLAQCEADGQSFALSWAEVADPAQIAQVLKQMRESLAAKLPAPPGAPQPVQVSGMTPNPEAQQQAFKGKQQQASLAVFTRGRRVYQALMLGKQGNAAAWDAFIGSLRLGA